MGRSKRHPVIPILPFFKTLFSNVFVLMATIQKAKRPSRAIIVHPLFAHSLPEPPQSASPPEWLHLPRECLLKIAFFLSAADLCNLAACNHELKDLAMDETVWEALCRRKFEVPTHRHSPPSWKRLYQFNHELFQSLLTGGRHQHRREGGRGTLPRLQRGANGGPIRISAAAGTG